MIPLSQDANPFSPQSSSRKVSFTRRGMAVALVVGCLGLFVLRTYRHGLQIDLMSGRTRTVNHSFSWCGILSVTEHPSRLERWLPADAHADLYAHPPEWHWVNRFPLGRHVSPHTTWHEADSDLHQIDLCHDLLNSPPEERRASAEAALAALRSRDLAQLRAVVDELVARLAEVGTQDELSLR